jgi:GNAT superfamily N-acetyltransferase
MLDKSLRYIQILMCRPPQPPPPPPVLPEGYALRLWTLEDAAHWADIEASVGEFPDAETAAAYYNQEFAPHPMELMERQLFVVSPEGTYVGTSSAWWAHTPEGLYWPSVHWVAVKPEFQGMGLGKALVAETLRILSETDGPVPYYLTTQTYSHKAIRLYRSFGFLFDADSLWPRVNETGNTTAEAVAYLEGLGLL